MSSIICPTSSKASWLPLGAAYFISFYVIIIDMVKQGKISLIICIMLAVVTGVTIFLLTQTDFMKTARIVPPMPILADCAKIESEIDKYDWDKDLATAVMKAESQCNTEAHGDEDLVYQQDGRDYGYSVGVFQVRILPGREDCDSYDVATNVACAYKIYTEKGGFEPWSGYTTGKYKQYTWRTIEETIKSMEGEGA